MVFMVIFDVDLDWFEMGLVLIVEGFCIVIGCGVGCEIFIFDVMVSVCYVIIWCEGVKIIMMDEGSMNGI